MSSVGKVHMPSLAASMASTSAPNGVNGHASAVEEDDEHEDALAPDYIKLLGSVTRDQVDQNLVRCPHAQTAERMVQVRQ